MNKEMIKALLYYLGAVLLGLDFIFNDFLIWLQVSLLWSLGLNIFWGAGLVIYFSYLKVYWGINREDITPVEPPIIFNTDTYVSNDVYTAFTSTDPEADNPD